jgi:NAD(P)H-dependent FMN reductase
VVGSDPQPDWLADRAVLAKNFMPRVRMKQIWRVAEDALEQAQDDATPAAIRDMERAGIDIITDGEMRRESHSNRFALALDALDVDTPAEAVGRTGKVTPVPLVVGRLGRRTPVEVRDMQFLRANTDHQAKITLPGPFTLSIQAKDADDGDEEAARRCAGLRHEVPPSRARLREAEGSRRRRRHRPPRTRGLNALRLLGLCGSTRTGSFNRALPAAAAALAPDSAAVEPWDLRRLPMYDDDNIRLAVFPADVVAFRDAVRAADGLVFATPQYKGSLPTLLKNAIDWASRAPDQIFDGKRAAVLTASNGALGGAFANHHLRQVLVCLNVFVLPQPEVMVGLAPARFLDGRLTDEPTREALRRHMATFSAWIRG